MFRVEWLPEAVSELADLWIKANSPFRQAITAAAHALDQELQSDPFRQSESREEDVRILFVDPLAILFEVDPQQRIIWILHVWTFRRRNA
jgi:hypothetical protein